jgi:hypothetical protein
MGIEDQQIEIQVLRFPFCNGSCIGSIIRCNVNKSYYVLGTLAATSKEILFNQV